MKKLLLGTAAVGLALSAAPAHAAIDLDIGGYFKGYGVYTDQDDETDVAGEAREFDILRNTEVHISGETTLDNGLTVGAHFEMEADGNYADNFQVEESYVYFAGNWGRVNFGAEDGAAFLLQVAAPSADSNVDGIRQLIDPLNYEAIGADTGNSQLTAAQSATLDYEQNPTSNADKLTYLSPIMSGFQLGLTYTPDVDDASTNRAQNEDDVAGDRLGSAYEAGLRYEGAFEGVDVAFGGGYTHVDEEGNAAANDDRQVWNVGLDLGFGPFGIGAAYKEDDAGYESSATRDDEETFVVGADYTTGAFKLGASYITQDNATTVKNLDAERYTGGVVYTYGPGMTFRGSVSYVEYDGVSGLASGGDEVDATSVLLGTQIKF